MARTIKTTVYFVASRHGAIEASLDKTNLPALGRGEKLVRVRVEFEV
jgi:hypothetical protein